MDGGFSHNGKTLLSAVDPAAKADRIADAVPVMDRTLYLCPSPLFGYGLERLLSRLSGAAPESALLCVEADPLLYALSLENIGPALKKHPKLRLTDRCQEGALCALIRREWGPRTFRRVQTVRLNGGWQLFPALYDTIAEALRKEIALDWGNALTLAKLGRLYIRNALRNLSLVPRCPSLARLSFGGDPVLALGAGPSLDKFLEAFPESAAEARPFRIVCVDTCLPALRQRGIKPDLVVILESQHWNLGDFTGLSGWDVPAAFDLSALPRSAAVLSGGLFLFFTPWTGLKIFGRLEASGLLPLKFTPLGSVGLSAVAIALRLSRGTVVTAGLDFSFTIDSYHARSTPDHLGRLRRQNRFSGLIDTGAAFSPASNAVSKNGAKVLSSPSLRNYRDLFEREFAGGEAALRLFDTAGSGLSLGIKTVSPEAAFQMLCSGGPAGAFQPLSENGIDALESAALAVKTKAFFQAEKARLIRLRNILSGEAAMDIRALENLIGECDYLWAHFPDYAAACRPPAGSDLEAGGPAVISFLKRLRAEADSFLRLLESAA